MDQPPVGTDALWAMDESDLLTHLGTRRGGLRTDEAARRSLDAAQAFIEPPHLPDWRLAVRQIENPIVLLLIGATFVSMVLGDVLDGSIILAITGASVLLGFLQERSAVHVIEDLLAAVRVTTDVRRDGAARAVALTGIVTGDVVELRAGSVVAGDARVIAADGLLLDESALTGESFPVTKQPGCLPADTDLGHRTNVVWCGTHVASGTGTAVVATVGADTEFGKVAARLTGAHVPTAFEVGLRRFGLLVMRAAGALVAVIFVVNIALGRGATEAMLFSLALAVGLTPQLLPAIVNVTLSYGARQMAHRRVIVKRLDAIEDIGAIDILCTDKTGTITSGTVELVESLGLDGAPSGVVARWASLNAGLQRGFRNPIDAAITDAVPVDTAVSLIDELPYDFNRRMLSVLVDDGERGALLITKGAADSVLARCGLAADDLAAHRQRFESLSAQGVRVLGLATRAWPDRTHRELSADDEAALEFAGFLCFSDPPKADAAAAVATLRGLGVATKVVTGDNRFAAAHAAAAVGVDTTTVATGTTIATLDDAELRGLVETVAVFAEVEPLQKERIVRALRSAGHAVGYLGDGINDAPSLRAADVGISVDSAVDIAKHSAAVVLLDKDLAVLAEGIRQGRRVFANTLKYVQVTLSANFGNMVSMAAAAAFLPFLPLLPRQILLLNFMSDIPGTMIAADRVDAEMVGDPHGWDIRHIRNFMIVFGLISSVFDVTTFLLLRGPFHADATRFHTGWFIESTATELAVMLVLRTRRVFVRSRPGMALLVSSLVVAAMTLALPYSPIAEQLGLDGPTATLLATLAGITGAYVVATEVAKTFTMRRGPVPARSSGAPDRSNSVSGARG